MPFYVIEVHDSDGNDCDVYDAIIEAKDLDTASEKLWKHLQDAFPGDESDGGYGTFHKCGCSCPHRKTTVCARCIDRWECSHGGLLTNEDVPGKYGPQEFPTYDAALKAHVYYHSLIDLTGE